MRYKVSIKNHIKHLLPLIIALAALAILWLYDGYNIFDPKYLIYMGLFISITALIPLGLTYFNYYLENRNKELIIDDTKRYFIYNGDRFYFEDIVKIEMHQSKMRLGKGVQLLPTSDCHYSKIFLKDGKIIYITSLLANDINFGLDEISVKIPRILASIPLEN